jgi:Iron-containing redox enzyme
VKASALLDPSASSLRQHQWYYDEWFKVPRTTPVHEVIVEAGKFVDDSRIEEHPYFTFVSSSKDALRVWVSQELVVTNPFSQLLLRFGASIRNVHIRTMVMDVAHGEHGRIRNGVAKLAHPWLLHQLGCSVGLDPDEVGPLPETRTFLARIEEACAKSDLSAAGALGMGSEKLLVPEYGAIKKAFEAAWPDCEFSTFLDANIDEDAYHTDVMINVAASLINLGEMEPSDFLDGAKVGVEARLDYYTSLLARYE